MASDELETLRHLSARVGSDPLLVQAAGGNTSLKRDGVMWIKASGTWLRDALRSDIFVPLDLARLTAALAADDPACEACTDFVRADLNARGLRPSIETSVHGLMPQRVVIHVHCVSTIAHVIQEDAERLTTEWLKGFNWAFVPYARPGLNLARAIKQALRPSVDVLVLGNHGLAVAGESVSAAEGLLDRVVEALRLAPRSLGSPDRGALAAKATGTEYRLPDDPACHGIALDPWARDLGCAHVFYPDHAVFLGTEIPEDLGKGAPAVVVPGAGVLVHKTAKPAIEPMLRCLADVFRRLAPGTKLKALTPAEIGQLLNWDAEKYRQSLNAK